MNKRNYNKEMQDEISSIGCRKPSMLLQCCCAPCATAVINRLKDFDVTLFYYNPNTFPESEYQKRLETLKEYVDKAKLGLNIVEIGYRDEDYLAAVSGFSDTTEGGPRCAVCIRTRLTKTAEYAKEHGFEYFASTLSVSPMKNAVVINDIGEELAKTYGVKYLVNDFKKENGFQESVNISKEFGLYRQDYCGCEASKNRRNT